MTHTATGVVHGNTIVLSAPLSVLEGQQVDVVVRASAESNMSDTSPFWTPEDDRILAEIREARKTSRRSEIAE